MFVSISLYTMLACSLTLNAWLLTRPSTRADVIETWLRVIAKLLGRGLAIGFIALAIILPGCDEPKVARRLPAPPPEVPVCNLPVELHQRNWLGSKGQGSCVHASLTNHLRWLNQFELGEWWRSQYSDGEWASQLRHRLDAAGIEYSFTEKADPRFLDWVSNTRTGCILWWKPAHCCTFMGWVVGQDGKQYAAILDNNYPGKFEYTEREQFIRLWAGYGGFALAVHHPATISLPYLSYEVL